MARFISIYRLLSAFLISAIVLTISCQDRNDNSKPDSGLTEIDKYTRELLQLRDEKDAYFKGPGSPLPESKLDSFEGIDYYPPDKDYNVEVIFEEFDKKDTVIFQTSKANKVKKYTRYGRFKFNIKNKSYKLAAYESVKYPGELFIPFTDLTNGKETYGAGRYLEMAVIKDGNYSLDFNRAFNPYCAYNKEKFTCPLVPLENALEISILAGEKYRTENIEMEQNAY